MFDVLLEIDGVERFLMERFQTSNIFLFVLFYFALSLKVVSRPHCDDFAFIKCWYYQFSEMHVVETDTL